MDIAFSLFLLDEDYKPFLTSRLGGMVFRMLSDLVNNMQRSRHLGYRCPAPKSRCISRTSRHLALLSLLQARLIDLKLPIKIVGGE
jgi:hypothetical protein